MSFKATLFLFNKAYPLLKFRYSLIQDVNCFGFPTSIVKDGKIKVAIASTGKDSGLYNAMFSPDTLVEGSIQVYKEDGISRKFEIEFANAYVCLFEEKFEALGNEPLQMEITIAPLVQKIRNHVFELPLNPNNPFNEEEVITVNRQEFEPATQITKLQWVNYDRQDEEIKEIRTLQKAALIVEIENPKGKTVKITIKKEDGSEFENGKTKLSFTETIYEDGCVTQSSIEIKEIWEVFKKVDKDRLIATVEHNGVIKRSKSLTIVPFPRAIVDFRPSKNYDGEYGFDYLRDKTEKKDDLTYKDILGTNSTVNGSNVFTPYATDDKYKDLKNNYYKTITFPWHTDTNDKDIDYVQSWLSIYPQQKVLLSLQIDTLENINSENFRFEYDSNLFRLSTETVPAQSKGKKRLKDHLEIECLKAFNSDEEIKVMYQERQLGQLNVLKNEKAHRKVAKVVFVRVKTELYNGIQIIGNTNNASGEAENQILSKYLKQALITLENEEVIFDLTGIDPVTNKPNYPDFNTNYTLLNSASNTISPPKILNKYHNSGGNSLAEHMEHIFNEAMPKYQDHFKIFFFGDKGGRSGRSGNIVRLAGYAKDFNSQSAIMFNGKRKATVTHELLHCMGLKHSFSNDADFEFKKKATENIMDYSSKRTHIWLWQWKKLWGNSKIKQE